MARCKDCIHFEPCLLLCQIRTGLCGDNADKVCKMFKPTADVVPRAEVAREIINYIVQHCGGVTSDNVEFEIGYLTAMNKVLATLIELKKKYTKEHCDGG